MNPQVIWISQDTAHRLPDDVIDQTSLVISIQTPGSDFIFPLKRIDKRSYNGIFAVLPLEFDDFTQVYPKHVIYGLSRLPVFFDNKFADKILNFVQINKKFVDLIICKCEAGISRSAGVAAALRKLFSQDVEDVFRRAVPNTLVYSTILRRAHERGI